MVIQMHTTKKIIEKENSHYTDKLLVAALTPPRQHKKSNIFKNDASKKGSVTRVIVI
jgi:hypothetical protein